MTKFKLDDKELQDHLKRIGRNIGNLRPFFEALVPIIHTSILANFRVGGRPKRWTPLSQGWTVKQRQKERTWGSAMQPILQRYNTLRTSIGQVRIIGTHRLEYGTALPKAIPLHYGRPARDATVTVKAHTRRITQAFGRSISPTVVAVRSFSRKQHFGRLPARPFVMFQKEDIERISNYAALFAFNPDKARQVLGQMRSGR